MTQNNNGVRIMNIPPIIKKVLLKPANPYIAEPITGPKMRPIPTAVSIKAMYFSCSSGKVTETIAYDVVWIDQDDIPCKNLNTNASIVNANREGAYGITPKPIMDRPIENSPVMRIFFLPTLDMQRPIIGDPKITATEYIQKMYPIIDTSTPSSLSSRGRKGTTSE